ncbi:MAG: polymer-forming cytoskeletal protein [Deltaproteobacteria bacterium]|nr:polymer-forming cytoskeletal protein [Deltaproteobacteria bacterium]
MAKKGIAKTNEIVGLLGKGTEFDGNLMFEGTVRIDGVYKGQVCTGGILIIGEGAYVDAEIEADTIIVSGEVHGRLKATRRVEIRGAGRVHGNVETPSLIVEDGVTFEGSCQMPPKDKKTENLHEETDNKTDNKSLTVDNLK